MAKKKSKAPTARSSARRSAPPAARRRVTAKKAVGKKTAAKKSVKRTSKPVSPRRSGSAGRPTAIADVRGANLRRDVGGVRLEVGSAGQGRVKRMIYPPGFKWSTDIRPHVGTDYCMHAHVGFLVAGRIDVTYADGCVEVYEAPQIVAVAPGHDGHVVGNEPAVLIEFDFEGDTIQRFGMPEAHTHR
jgi:hypothetical protein